MRKASLSASLQPTGARSLAGIKTPVSATPVRTALRLRNLIPLVKPRIIFLLMVTGAVAALVASEGHVAPGRLFLFSLVALLASGGSACLNHLFERDIDALMERTRRRPLPAGLVTPTEAAMLAVLLIAASIPVAWIWLGGGVALQLALGVSVYSGLYTLVLKRRTPMNIVIGGIAGSNMALAGWALVDPSLQAGGWVLALIIFLWTPPHAWGLAIARDADYRAGGIPMLPQTAGISRTARSMAIYAILTWAATLFLARVAPLGLFYLITAGLLGAGFAGACIWLWLRPGRRLAMAVFKSSGPYLGMLLLSMAVDVWMHR